MLSKETFRYKINIGSGNSINFETENDLDKKIKSIYMYKYTNCCYHSFTIKSKYELEEIIKKLQELGDKLWPTQKI